MAQTTLIKFGDITDLEVDAIVNPANTTLMGGGGLDGLIHRKAGFQLNYECQKLNGCDTGKAKYTNSYNLKCKYIIHTVGPRYGFEGGKERELLENCYISILKVSEELKIKTIAIPAISTGIYGYPKDKACKIAISSVKEYLKLSKSNLKILYFVLFDEESFELYKHNILLH